jgi:hypothetical protein
VSHRSIDGASPLIAAFADAALLSGDAILLVDLDGGVLTCNQAAREVIAALRTGANMFDLVADAKHTLREQLQYWARSDEVRPGLLTFREGSSGEIRCRCRGARLGQTPGIVRISIVPIGERERSRTTNERLARLGRERGFLHRIAESERTLEAERLALRQLREIHVLTTELADAASVSEALDIIAKRVPGLVGAFNAVVALPMPRPLTAPSLPLHESGRDALADLNEAEGEWFDAVDEPVRVSEPRRPLASFVPEVAGIEHDAVCVPLAAHGVQSGRLLLAVEPGRGPSADDPKVLAVARAIGSAIARTTLLEHAQRTSELLQRRLLPSLPELPGVTVASRYVPGTDQTVVGGDWYDVFALRGGAVGIAIGDVAGHGLAQATVMAELRSALRAIALDTGTRPGDTMAQMQRFVLEYLPDDLVTMCYLVLDRDGTRLRYVNAGHLPPLLMPEGRPPRLLESALAPPLGSPGVHAYPHAAVSVSDHDTLALYTDGLVERRGESLTDGLGRLLARAGELGDAGPEDLCEAFTEIRSTDGPRDDLALLAVRIQEPDGTRQHLNWRSS